MREKKDISCDLCGSDKQRFLFDGKDRLHGCDGSFSYVKCTNCGLVYMNPQISIEDIGSFYPADYAPHQSKFSNSSNQSGSRIKPRFRKDSPQAFICQKLNINSRLLDVGCGSGSFLNKIRNHTGCQVFGVDVSETAVAAAKLDYNLDVFQGTLTEVSFPAGYFELITAWSYLEHVNNPTEVLQKFHELLKTDGNCVISTPNFDSFNAGVFKDKWYHLDCPRHFYIFTPETITTVLEKSGFMVRKIVHEKSSKGLLGSLQYYFYDNNFDPRYRNKIRRSAFLKAFASPLARVMSLIKKADMMVIYASKK